MANNGKDLENVLSAALTQHQAQHSSHFLRLYDQTSSGGRGFKQDGDFIWLVDGRSVLLECKSTEVGTDLVSMIKASKRSKDQLAKHKLWHRAQCKTGYLWADVSAKFVVFFDGQSVVSAIEEKTKPTPIKVRSMDDMLPLVFDMAQFLRGDQCN